MMILRHFLLLLVISILYSPSNAQIFTTSYDPGSVDPSGEAHYAMYIPPSTDTVRGIYFYIPGWQGSSLDIVENEVYKDLVEKHKFALLGTEMLGSYTSNIEEVSLWSGEATLQALENLALISGHNEIAFMPLYLDGNSAGGQFAYHFTRFRPDRVIAFVTMKGGYHSTAENTAEVRQVPGYLFMGENDSQYRLVNLSSIFYANRSEGAVWAMAIEPNTGHSRVSDTAVLFSYFRSIISLRLPEEVSEDYSVQLRTIVPDSGWMGSNINFLIGSSQCYTRDIDSASWFPDKICARSWQAFVSEGHTEEVVNCNSDLTSFKHAYEIQIYPNPIEGEFQVYINNVYKNDAQYKLMNMKGKYLQEGSLNDGIIKINSITPGAYILQIQWNEKITHRLIVIK